MKTQADRRKVLHKSWQFLFWLGPVLSIAGLSAGFVAGEWFPIPGGLIVTGIVLMGLWLVYRASTTQGFWSRRSTEVWTNAAIATASVLLILGLINFLSTRFPLLLDLTENQQLSLAPQSRQVVEQLQEPVKVWLFSRDQRPIDVTLLENYQRLNRSNFKFEYVDVQTQPGTAEKFDVQTVGEVHLESGDKKQLVQNISSQRLSEVNLTDRLAQLSVGKQPVAYFLQGHQEKPLEAVRGGMSEAKTALEEKGYKVEVLNLVERSQIPEDASVVAVMGATKKLFDSEVKAIETYLQQGGGVLLSIDPNTEPNTDPGLQPLLDKWGVETDDRFAIDPERWTQGLGKAAPVVVDYGDHPITQSFGKNFSLYPLVRSFDLKKIDGIEAMPLLFTSDASWAESNLQEGPDWKFDPGSDRKGPLVLGVALSQDVQETSESSSASTENSEKVDSSSSENQASEKNEEEKETTTQNSEENSEETVDGNIDSQSSQTPEETKPEETTDSAEDPKDPKKQSRLVVIGDSDFASNTLFQNYLNGDMFLNSIDWLSQEDDTVLSIRPKEPNNRTLKVTPKQARVLVTLALTVPVMAFAASGLLWWSRR
ncbi:MAG: Gldg family protein [Geitlerinemataceae cyanobacterium]